MGTPFHHYIIADEHIIPKGDEIYFSEKVERLSCYQPNDRKRTVSDKTPSRSDEGLPEGAFIYCCLNGVQKITPQMFDCWMTILSRSPGSVLWLLSAAEDTHARLRDLAAEKGVSRERLIFAAKKPNPDHLARYPLADLFLDTHPYGAHTTAADALWMGVPVLTVPGKSFASRVCSSLAHAAGIGELACPTKEIYVARAIELAGNPAKILELKARLNANRRSSLLFDTPRLVRELENAYRRMWEEFRSGRRPIPDLTNLEVYHDVGVELAGEGEVPPTRDEYRQRYRDKLEVRNLMSPIRPDARLWSEEIGVRLD